ncbi:MAG: 4Fe-4S binding protein [Planctomycetota bacterium]
MGTDDRRRRAILVSVASLGFTAIVAQMVALREFLHLFAGNELGIGLILANWLLLTGIGSLLGRRTHRWRSPVRWILAGEVLLAVLPLAQLVGVRLLRGAWPPGTMAGAGEMLWRSLLLLLPFCLVSGFLLALFSGQASSRREADQIGDVYVLDSAGGILGGAVFAFVLVPVLPPVSIAALLLFLNLGTAIWLSWSVGERGWGWSAAALLVAGAGILAAIDLERMTARAMFPGAALLYAESTPYGHLAVTERAGEIAVYENGLPIGSTADPVAAEEAVHYALALHPDPRRVLLVSGGLVGAIAEIAKHPVESIDYVELDPAVLAIAARVHSSASDPRVHPIAADARRFIRTVRASYDAILVTLPDPSSAQLNRYYTVEFFAAAKRALREGGVLGLRLTGAENYADPAVRLLAASVHRSLATVFARVLVVPGGEMHIVAADRPLTYEIAAALERRGIETSFVRREYLAAKLTADRIEAGKEMVAGAAPANRDLRPVCYLVHLRYWLRRFGGNLLVPLLYAGGLVILIGALLAAAPRRAVPAALATSGCAGMGLEVVLLIAFQIHHGSLHREIATIITAFLLGTALGAGWGGRPSRRPARVLFGADVLLAGLALVLGGLASAAGAGGDPLAAAVVPPWLFAGANGLVGFLVGAQFPPAARLCFTKVEDTAGSLWAFDLLGAALGAIAVSVLCIPLLGVAGTCFLAGGIKTASTLLLAARRAAWSRAASPSPAAPFLGPSLAFGIALLVFAGIGVAIVAEDSSAAIYGFSFRPAYHWLLVLLLGLGLVQAVGGRLLPERGGAVVSAVRRAFDALHRTTRLRAYQWACYSAFALVGFYPVFRCYFTVPYLFCHVCPRQCVFGYLRPYLVPAALLMNLERRFWCHRACPIGTLGIAQGRVCRRSRRWPAAVQILSIAILIFTAVSYFEIRSDYAVQPDVEGDWYTFFYTNVFAASATVIAVAAGVVLLTLRWRRTFCEALCPIGRFSELVLAGDGRLARRRERRVRRRPSRLREARET